MPFGVFIGPNGGRRIGPNGGVLITNADGRCPNCGCAGGCCGSPGVTCDIPIVGGQLQWQVQWSASATTTYAPMRTPWDAVRPTFVSPQVVLSATAEGLVNQSQPAVPVGQTTPNCRVNRYAEPGNFRLLTDFSQVDPETLAPIYNSITSAGTGTFASNIPVSRGTFPLLGDGIDPPFGFAAGVQNYGINQLGAGFNRPDLLLAGTVVQNTVLRGQLRLPGTALYRFGDLMPPTPARVAQYPTDQFVNRLSLRVASNGAWGLFSDTAAFPLTGIESLSATVNVQQSGGCVVGADLQLTFRVRAPAIFNQGNLVQDEAIVDSQSQMSLRILGLSPCAAARGAGQSLLPPQQIPDDFNPAAEYRGCCDPPPIQAD